MRSWELKGERRPPLLEHIDRMKKLSSQLKFDPCSNEHYLSSSGKKFRPVWDLNPI